MNMNVNRFATLTCTVKTKLYKSSERSFSNLKVLEFDRCATQSYFGSAHARPQLWKQIVTIDHPRLYYSAFCGSATITSSKLNYERHFLESTCSSCLFRRRLVHDLRKGGRPILNSLTRKVKQHTALYHTPNHKENKKTGGKSETNRSNKYRELREDVMTVPNFLSGLRIALSPVIGYFAILDQYSLALGILGIAAMTDLLDGYIARHFQSQKSVFGSILDPAADKILMTTLVISLSVAGLIPVSLGVLIVGRDVALVAGVSYLRFKTLPAPRTLVRYFDVNHPTVQLHPTMISKVNTFLQMGLLGAVLAAPVCGMADSSLLTAYMYLVASTTVISAFSYVFSKDTFRILKSLPK